MTTCQVKKVALFVLSEGPHATDRNFHLVRMALSIALDAQPQLVLSQDAVRIASCGQETAQPLNDVVSQVRLLREMEVPIYVVEEDALGRGIAKEDLLPGFTALARERMGALFDTACLVLVA